MSTTISNRPALAQSSQSVSQASKKRSHPSSSSNNNSDQPPKKKSKQPQKQPSKTDKAQDSKYQPLAPAPLATFFSTLIHKHSPDLTPIEISDRTIPLPALEDTTAFPLPRTLENLRAFLEVFADGPAALRSCAAQSSPHTIVLSPSAMRSMHVKRVVDVYGSAESRIAKLFSKHIRYEEARGYVQKTRFGIGVGTCGRVEELIVGRRGGEENSQSQSRSQTERRDGAETDGGVLKLDQLKRIVVDGSYVDEKKRGMFDEAAVFKALVSLLNVEALKLRLARRETMVYFY